MNGSGSHDQHVISEFANNVIFNWAKSNSAYGGECNYAGNSKVNPSYNRVYMINNLYRPGPTTKSSVKTRYFVQGDSTNLHGYGEWYLKGNKFDISTTAKYSYVPTDSRWSKTAIDRVNADNFWGVESIDGNRAFNFRDLSAQRLKCCLKSRMLRDFPADGLGMYTKYEDYESADEAFRNVIANAGANLPRLDACDRRLLAEAAGETAMTRTNPTKSSYVGIIDSPDELGYADSAYHDTYVAGNKTYTNYPFLGLYPGETNDLTDTDGDGMPDQYEIANGLNPNDVRDGAKVTENGYTNVEIFLNAVVAGTVNRNGTPTSISHITADLLYECYNTFYNPANMALTVAGNVTVEQVLKVADKMLKATESKKIERKFMEEPTNVVEKIAIKNLPVSMPIFAIGFKENIKTPCRTLKESIVSNMLLDIIAGKTSSLYEKLLDEGLINTAFDTEYFEGYGYSAHIFTGESYEYEKVREYMKNLLNNLNMDIPMCRANLLGVIKRNKINGWHE